MRSLTRFLCAFALVATSFGAFAAPKAPKWLVLDPITYQKGVDRTAFDGIDQLLLTRLVQAKKYKCLDRDAYDTAAREEGFGAEVELVPAGYSMRGEVVQIGRTGKSRMIGGVSMPQYVATVSLRANNLKTQEAYEAETLRVVDYCQTPKDMLVTVVKRVALAILMRDYPMYVMDEDEDELTLSYGGDFISVGEQYEIRRRKEIVDDDTGDVVYKEKTVGVCEVTDVGKNTSTAKLVSGRVKVKDVLRFYEADTFVVPPAAPAAVPAPAPVVEKTVSASPYPRKQPRIAVAPFITKQPAFSVWGTPVETRTWMDDTASHLTTALTQTESFKVLDRAFGPEIDRELNRIANDPNADPNDVCRLSRKLATDYLVVAEVKFFDVASPGVDYATGILKAPASTVFAEVRFRCVVAPTTQIALADTLRIESPSRTMASEQFISSTGEIAAQQIAAAIQSRLDPEGFARYQAVLKARAEAEAAAAAAVPAPAPASPGISLGF